MNRVPVEDYANIPAELKSLRCWCIAGPDKAPYYVNGGTVFSASSTGPRTWKSFDDTLIDMATTGSPAMGFMLSFEAGLTCIDLDVKDADNEPNPAKWTKQEDFDRFQKILSVFDTYVERSVSGKGLHLWLFGRIGAGARREFVEVYSQERFIICTGDVFNHKPICGNDEMLDLLVQEIRGPNYNGPGALVEVEPEEDDAAVWEKAVNASNADKFSALVRGEWQGSYPSQSEADLSLMSMFTFYSKSNEQCRRLFRATALGQRTKATKNDRYLNYTLELIRGRQARDSIVDQEAAEMARRLVQSLQASTFADVAAGKLANSEAHVEEVAGAVDWPPGNAGLLAHFIYKSAPRPVKEIAIVAALGFLAGITGRAYNIFNSGLNLYIILVARSGVGKEALHSGVSLLCAMLRETAPHAQNFVSFDDFVSGPALKKACMTQSSFVNIAGEWGRKLKRLAADDGDSAMATLRTEMTNLYQKSGSGNIVGGIAYSNKEQNVGMVTGVAYSMVGETTPGTFYESLTPSMMEDGFLSRFLIVEYAGDRPPMNYHKEKEVPKGLAQAISGLSATAISHNMKNHVEHVVTSEEASKMLHSFDLECDYQINRTKDEAVRQMWNRAHLKACRVAAVLAVSDNWQQPVISKEHADWALQMIRMDIRIMGVKINSGDIGSGDDSTRDKKILSIIMEYAESPELAPAYGVPDGMREKGIIAHRFLQQRCAQLTQFRKARQGAKKALEDTVRSLTDGGYIQEVPRDYLAKEFQYLGKAYRIVAFPHQE